MERGKGMKVLFIGNMIGVGSVGEEADERHITRCLDQTGTQTITVDRGEIHAFFTGAKKDNIPEPQDFDVIVLCKWHHFTEEIIKGIKERYKAPIVYWVWDWMWKHKEEGGRTVDWHKMLLKNTDLYVSGELGMADKIKELGGKFQYFNWDSSDGQYDQLPRDEKYDVTFTGSYIPHSYRNEYLKAIHDKFNLTIFSHDFETWRKEGFNAEAGKYAGEFNQISAQSKVMVVMNWVSPSKETIGYQSNRIGKILTTGGLPLVHYFPLAERLLGDNVMFFYNIPDMLNKIDWLLGHPEQRETQRVKSYDFGRREYTTQTRMRQFKTLLENFVLEYNSSSTS